MLRTAWIPWLLGGALCCAAVEPGAAEELPELQATNDPRFELPVQVEAGDPAIAEVRLYVSSDAGKTWSPAHRARPPVAGFTFDAPGDGEYWFCVRTVDGAGKEDGAAAAKTPELRVLVDVAAPLLEVQAQRTADGDLAIAWTCRDRHWNVDSLKITYRTADDPTWRSVQSLRSKRHGDPASGGGETVWTPPAGVPLAAVRVEVRDEAGNVTIKEVSLNAEGVAPPVRNEPAPSDATAAKTDKPRDPWKPLWVNSLSFELDYDVGRVPPAAIDEVTVWGTRDDGRSWVKLGADDDRRSPCAVNVDREGMYGFTIVVTAGGNSSSTPPQPGTPPEIRVGVDLNKPQVRLTTAEPDPEGRACAMKLNWHAVDEHLNAQAVSLAYSAGPNGPWLPLALGVPNDGVRVCEFDPQGPDAVYLRIEVRDEAGNLGAFSTTAAIPVDKRSREARFVGAADGGQPKSAPKWFHVLR